MRRPLLLLELAGIVLLVGARCAHEEPEPPPVTYVAPAPDPEEVVREFLRLVERDSMTEEQLERLVAIEALAANLGLEPVTGLSSEQQHRLLLESLVTVLRGDGPARQLMTRGSLVPMGQQIHGARAVVVIGQNLPERGVVRQPVELERFDGRWKIRAFPEPAP